MLGLVQVHVDGQVELLGQGGDMTEAVVRHRVWGMRCESRLDEWLGAKLVMDPGALGNVLVRISGPYGGRFDDDEVVLLGDTLAHEAGHYLGLTHPVEDGFAQWDALADTEECSDQFECEDALADNNMYPYPICSRSACAPQDVLTDDQAAVLSRYTGVR